MITALFVKRVSLTFNWILFTPWEGFENPWPAPVPCQDCQASGYNKSTKKILDSFPVWSKKITMIEIKELLSNSSTASAVKNILDNIQSDDIFIVKFSLVEIRAKRKGVFGMCPICDGEGIVPNSNPAVAQLYEGVNLFESWKPIEPPSGKGWQLWENNSMPISPVFETSDQLATYCESNVKIDGTFISNQKWCQWLLTFQHDALPHPNLHSPPQATFFN